MSSEITVKFVVYDIRSYFWQQPGELKCCPLCGKSISSAEIPPSRAVATALQLGQGNIPAHYFSYLYKCQACPWWGIRESWAFLESSGMSDYLIVEPEDKVERRDSQTPPWEQILEELNIYKYVQPLPEKLGKLFIGGVSYSSLESVRKSLWKDVQEFTINYAKSKTQKKG